MKPVFVDLQEGHWDEVSEALGVPLSQDLKGLSVVDEETGELFAAALFNSWTKTSVCVHQYIKNPFVLKHGFYELIAEYVYVHNGRAIMYGVVPSTNEKALKVDKNIGFEEVARLKDAVDFGVDMVVLELRKENCRFLPEEYRRAS